MNRNMYDLLDRLAEEFAARFRRGERPPLSEYTDRYPELADDIRELFPAMVKVERPRACGKAEEEIESFPTANPLPREIGDYRILREIGRGGMGVVYEAEQISLGRRVALKVLPRQIGRDRMVQERFRREARAAAKLHHTNIVPVFEVGQDGDVRFYAMQYIQGQGLDTVITELRRLRDRSKSDPSIRSASDGRSHQSRRERSRPGVPDPKLGDEFEISAVLRLILTGGFDAGGQVASNLDVSPSSPARGMDAGLMTTVGATPESRPAEADPAFLKTEADSEIVAQAIGSNGEYSSVSALSSSASLSSSSAILPGGTQLSSVESGRRGFFRGLAQIGRQVAGGLSLCPCPGDRAPRHQAVELAPGLRRGGLDRRFRPGQGG